MANFGTGPTGVNGNITDVDTVQRNPLGLIRADEDYNQYIYLPGVAATAAGNFVGFIATGLQTYVTTLLVTAATYSASVGVAMGAILAANWGWFQIYGFNAAASFATATITTPLGLYTSSTAGRATTTAGAATAIFGGSATVTSASNVGGVWLNYPFTGGNATV
jgi:hypothetical protein